jgi:hypothetical protein
VVEQGYQVQSIRPTQSGYFEEVRRLVEMFEEWMKLAEEQPWEVAIEAEVSRFELEDEMPF